MIDITPGLIDMSAIENPAAPPQQSVTEIIDSNGFGAIPSGDQPSIKPLGSSILKDAGRFINNLSAMGQPASIQDLGKRGNSSTGERSSVSTSVSMGGGQAQLDSQILRLKQASEYAGYMSATVSLVGSAVASFKQLQQG